MAPSLNITLRALDVRDAAEIERTVTAFSQEPNGGLIVPLSGLAISHRDLIVTLADVARGTDCRRSIPIGRSSPPVASFPTGLT